MSFTTASKVRPGQVARRVDWRSRPASEIATVEQSGSRILVTYVDGFVSRCAPQSKFEVVR